VIEQPQSELPVTELSPAGKRGTADDITTADE